MDRELEDFQFLGFFGILKEAFKITTSYRKIFSQITLCLILPFSFMYLAQINEYAILGEINPDKNLWESQRYSIISDFIFWILFPPILVICWISAVVSAIACIYTGNEVTYTAVMKGVPKVWKRLMITSILNFVGFLVLIGGALFATIKWIVILPPGAGGIMIVIINLIFLSVVVYMSFVCHLANVVSVLEDLYGYQAMLKSQSLIKGNTGLCAAFFLIHNLCFLGIHLGFVASAVGGDSLWYMMLGVVLWSVLMSMLILFGLVIQTIIYFICKSNHRENIYFQLDTKDILLQQSNV